MEHALAGLVQYGAIALLFFLWTLLAIAGGKYRSYRRRRTLEQLEGQAMWRALPEKDSRGELFIEAGWLARGEGAYATRVEIGECHLAIGHGPDQSLTFELEIVFSQPFPIAFDLAVKIESGKERALILVHEPDPDRIGERVEDWKIVSTAARGHVLLREDYQRCEAHGLFEALFVSNRIMPRAARFDLRIASLEVDATRLKLIGSTSRVNPLNFYFTRKKREREIATSLAHDAMTLVTSLEQSTHDEIALLTRMSEAHGLHQNTREVVASWRDSELDEQALFDLRMRHVREKMIPQEAGERELTMLLESARKEDALGVLISESKRPSGARLRHLFLRVAPDLIATRLEKEALDEWIWFAFTEPDEATRHENLNNGHHLASANAVLDERIPKRMRLGLLQKIVMERSEDELPMILTDIISARDLDEDLLVLAYSTTQALLPDWHVTALVEMAMEFMECGSRQSTERALALLATFHIRRAEVMRTTPGFEALLCERLKDPASHARRLLGGVGGLYTIRVLMDPEGAHHVLLGVSEREQLCDTIRARLDGADLDGAMSLAAHDLGGELSLTAESGSLEALDE